MKTPRHITVRTLTAVGLTGVLLGTGALGAQAADIGVAHLPGGHRVAGADRITTAMAASQSVTDTRILSTGAVVLASSQNYADAIAGGVVAGRYGATLLLTDPDHLRADVSDVIYRRGHASNAIASVAGGPSVTIMGGERAISASVAEQIAARGADVERFAGTDRFATAAAAAKPGYGSRRTGPTPTAAPTPSSGVTAMRPRWL